MSPQEKVEFVTDRVTKKLELDSQQQQNFSTLAQTWLNPIVATLGLIEA